MDMIVMDIPVPHLGGSLVKKSPYMGHVLWGSNFARTKSLYRHPKEGIHLMKHNGWYFFRS
jgi:hypothetical protein